MKFGNPSEFAIEFKLNESYGGDWLYGKFCFWIKGMAIGNYDLGASLRDILFLMKTILRDNGNRFHQGLYCLETIDLFKRLDDALFGHGSSQYDEVANEECWARFNITLPVDIFDKCKIFLVENKENARIIYKCPDVEDENISEIFLTQGLFDQIIEEAYNVLDSLYNEEVQ